MYNAVLEQVHCNPNRNLSQEKLMIAADCYFIERAENMPITGTIGCSKSYFICALEWQAYFFGYRMLYFGINRFLEKFPTPNWMDHL
jgi:DNA replication protein DnaC